MVQPETPHKTHISPSRQLSITENVMMGAKRSQIAFSSGSSLRQSAVVSPSISIQSLQYARIDADYIAEEITCQIRQYRLQDYKKFLLRITVRPPPDACPLYNDFGTFFGYRTYRFDVGWGVPERDIHVRVLSNGHLLLEFGTAWKPMGEFLDTLEPPVDTALDTLRGRLDRQWQWWMSNGKQFRISDLPAEVRDMIYRHCFGARLEPYPVCKARRLGPNTSIILARQPSMGILRLNKLTYTEASDVLYLYTTFFVEHLAVLHRLMSNKDARLRIRRMELALSDVDYLKLFDCNISGELVPMASGAASALRCMTLSLLKLTFTTPSRHAADASLHGTSQSAVVDCILDGAWRWLRGQPLLLQGDLKTAQKVAFEAKIKLERTRIETWHASYEQLGLKKRTTLEYYEWMELQDDTEGGVRVDD